MSVDTGDVLAYQFMSKGCTRRESKLDGKCGEVSCMKKKHTGSSKSIETAATSVSSNGKAYLNTI